MNALALRNFATIKYQIPLWADMQRDEARQEPQITAGTIFTAMVYRPTLGAKSWLQVDQKARLAPLKQLTGSTREMVVSDSTLSRVLPKWDLGPTRMASYALHQRLKQAGLATVELSTGRRVRLAVADGSDFGGHLKSVLGFAGKIYQAVDLEESDGRGHELVTSRALLMRAQEYLGPGFATHVLYDGLMADRIDFRFMRKVVKSHLVVKTREETLEIIQSSKQVWSSWPEDKLKRCGVEIVRGTDVERGIVYEVRAQSGIIWDGLEFPLNLAWVRETHLKGKYAGQTLEFWVITTDESLSAEELRELAHKRWAIENNGFKELNERLGSKAAYVKNPQAKQAELLMGFIGMTLLKAFKAYLETLEEWRKLTVRKTKNWLAWAIESGIGIGGVVGPVAVPP